MTSVEDYAEKWARIVDCAREAGRDRTELTAGCLFLTVAGEDEAVLERMLDNPWVRALALSQPASQFERHGARHRWASTAPACAASSRPTPAWPSTGPSSPRSRSPW